MCLSRHVCNFFQEKKNFTNTLIFKKQSFKHALKQWYQLILAPVGSRAPPCCQAGGMGWVRNRVNKAFWSQCLNRSPQIGTSNGLGFIFSLLRMNSLALCPLLFMIVFPVPCSFLRISLISIWFLKILLAFLRIKVEFIFKRLASFPSQEVESIRGCRNFQQSLNRLMLGQRTAWYPHLEMETVWRTVVTLGLFGT